MEPQKKKRAVNWSPEEKEILRFLIAKSAHIIEDKSTKSCVNFRKVKEWKKITARFHELTGNNRSTMELKLAWKRMKTTIRANLSKHKRETTKTTDVGSLPSASAEDLVKAIPQQDFQIELNNDDSEPQFTEYPEPQPRRRQYHIIFADPLSGPNQDHKYCAEPSPAGEDNNLEDQASSDIEIPETAKSTKRNAGVQKSSSEVLHKILETNSEFRKAQLRMMKVEHFYNLKLTQLRIKKLQLEIALMENQKNNTM